MTIKLYLVAASSDADYCRLGLNGRDNAHDPAPCRFGLAACLASILMAIIFVGVDVMRSTFTSSPSHHDPLLSDCVCAIVISLLLLSSSVYSAVGLGRTVKTINDFGQDVTGSFMASAIFFIIFMSLAMLLWVRIV